jgi:hypothetical protein
MTTQLRDSESMLAGPEHASLCEALDRVLNKGAVVVGELTISVADIDLIYLGLQVVLTSIETARNLSASPHTQLRSEGIAEASDVVQ